jgi:hypothetical protein
VTSDFSCCQPNPVTSTRDQGISQDAEIPDAGNAVWANDLCWVEGVANKSDPKVSDDSRIVVFIADVGFLGLRDGSYVVLKPVISRNDELYLLKPPLIKFVHSTRKALKVFGF